MNDQRQKKLEITKDTHIVYHGEQFPIKNQKISVLLQKIEESQINLNKAENNEMKIEGEISNYEEKIGFFKNSYFILKTILNVNFLC